MLGSGTILVTTVIGFGMSATFIVFVCTRIICGRLRGGVESRMMYQIESRYDIEQPEHHVNDPDPEPVLLEAIPTLKFNQEAFSSIEDTHGIVFILKCNSGVPTPNRIRFFLTESAGIGYGDSSCGPSIPSSSKLLIKGGTVVNAHHQQIADVYIEDGVIVAVNPTITVGDEGRVIDATGKFVMPGGIDPHTHLEFEFMNTVTKDEFFSGQAAALAGGTTMPIDFAIPIDGSLTAGFKAYEKKAKKSCMDYGFHMAITKWDETVAREMELMVKEKGINSFKFFMAYKGALMIGDELLLQGLKKCKSLGALAMVHAENGDAVDEGQKKMIELGITGPEGHALSRPPVVLMLEPNYLLLATLVKICMLLSCNHSSSTFILINFFISVDESHLAVRRRGNCSCYSLSRFVNTPLYVVHVMSIDAMEEIAKARTSDPVISDALGGILVGLVSSHDGGVENVTFIVGNRFFAVTEI
ncbi:dihydropyrimidinase [Lathyrus oleraceus]|uniref:dihydropyrimidinase n=1 Tax=Pisum sativum TaxID=3888 RepID=A0A9D4Y2R3_PEA|nr:dihydropyrimidinase [Pisum sativum]